MNITLKKLSIYERMSEETTAFTADIYADGKKVGYAKNDGRGGETCCSPYADSIQAFKLVESYAKSLPPTKEVLSGQVVVFETSIETIVDAIVYKEAQNREMKRFQAKMNKAMVNGIVVGVKNSNSYRVFKLNKGQTIAGIPKDVLKKLVASIQLKLQKGEEILNTNL